MLYPKSAEKMRHARLALKGATSENIIELCKQYLTLLAEYRDELYELPRTLDLNPQSRSASSWGDVDANRKAARAAIEQTTQERNRAEALLLSFTAISGYGAVVTFNKQKYMGHDDWQLSAGGVNFSDGAGDQRMTIQAAVETASLLRREEHVTGNAAAAGAGQTTCPDISSSEAELCKEGHDDNL